MAFDEGDVSKFSMMSFPLGSLPASSATRFQDAQIIWFALNEVNAQFCGTGTVPRAVASLVQTTSHFSEIGSLPLNGVKLRKKRLRNTRK
jgi:hypothetical protein